MNRVLDLPAESPYFEGHFPGRPILPGVTLLALALNAMRGAGDTRPLGRIDFARLRQPVLPGARLSFDVREDRDDAVRLDVRRKDTLVANAAFAMRAPGDPPCADVPQRTARETPPFDLLLPHRLPMRFVTAVLQETSLGLACEALIPSACPLVDEGRAVALIVIEAAAQTAAAWEALRRIRAGGAPGPRQGYLVALRDIELFAAQVPADTPLVASVRLEAAALPLSHYAIEVARDGRMIARGSMSTFLVRDASLP